MKRFTCIMIMAGFFLMAAAGPAALVYASSCDQENYQASGGQTLSGTDFSDLDVDGDESLSFAEFQKVFTSTEQKAFDRLDSDKDGTLSREEWRQFKEMHKGMGKKYHHKNKKRYHKEKLPDASKFNAHFPDMDTDHNDQVNFDEFSAYFTDAPDKQKVFNAIDLDESGYIDHGEWHAFKAAHGLKHMD